MTARLGLGITIGVLLGATIYEALVALQAIELGSQPGEGAPGEGVVLLAALLAILGGAMLVLFEPRSRAGIFLPLLAAAFMVARFYTFDPDYLPTLRRRFDDGTLNPVLVYAAAAFALAAAGCLSARLRVAAPAAAAAMLLCGLLAWAATGLH